MFRRPRLRRTARFATALCGLSVVAVIFIRAAPSARAFTSQATQTTWAAQISGDSGRLWGVSFVDVSHGWAVGDHGVFATTNGGGVVEAVDTTGPQPSRRSMH